MCPSFCCCCYVWCVRALVQLICLFSLSMTKPPHRNPISLRRSALQAPFSLSLSLTTGVQYRIHDPQKSFSQALSSPFLHTFFTAYKVPFSHHDRPPLFLLSFSSLSPLFLLSFSSQISLSSSSNGTILHYHLWGSIGLRSLSLIPLLVLVFCSSFLRSSLHTSHTLLSLRQYICYRVHSTYHFLNISCSFLFFYLYVL